MRSDRCPDCGAVVPNGRAGCQAAFDELSAKAYVDLTYASVQPLAFDSYCMQHVDKYCRSAKSYAAHLTRLCCGLEHEGDADVYAAIQRWLNGSVDIQKPPILNDRGKMTIIDVKMARGIEKHTQLVHRWAGDVWSAYTSQHQLARDWIRIALAGKAKR